ncbi:MAG: translation initiation factor IF-2 [Erysipelotrichaceae bacterium]|nr:translation initiation factor IF-2 [Erysipelotrichaceae bacterium]MDD4642209.1 translation initiation factor IF-2 [Erysipelotrichaceae bacterium]
MARPKKTNNRKKRSNNERQTFKPKKNFPTEITYYEGITVGDLAERTGRNASDIIKILFLLGKMVTINTSMDEESIQLVCLDLNIEATKEEESIDEDSLEDLEEDDERLLKERAPIVTIMGHVDHGKTTLLDTIRKSHVVTSEFGGITQHIGAYQVTVNNKKITFLDTPGHEAFTAMRARGAKVTDITVIVVAADDGVMPQTKEAVDHAKAAACPIIVAINKIDKPNVNFERIMSEMADLGLMPEEWGGDTIFVKLSALTGEGVNNLLETIAVLSEVLNLRANPDRNASGTVIEAKLDKGRGPVTTLLIQNGTLKTGDTLVVGACFGRVRKMTDDRGREIKEALPSSPVEIIGLNDVPVAGDNFKVFSNEKKARDIASRRSQNKIENERRSSSALSLEDLSRQIQEGDVQEIPIIIKADVQGSAEAVKQSFEKIDVMGVKVNVIRSTAGAINESDIMLASASNALVYGFNVRPDANVRRKATEENVEIHLHKIIYKAIEEVEAAMKGMLAPVFEEIILGQATVRQIFKVSKIGTIAGCMVTDGKFVRDCSVRLIRNGVVVYDGKLGSLKRFQNDVKEVAAGYECGLTIQNFNDLKEGDILEAYGQEEVEQV